MSDDMPDEDLIDLRSLLFKAPKEASSDTRGIGVALFEFFTAYVEAGFTEHQALELLALMIVNAHTDE